MISSCFDSTIDSIGEDGNVALILYIAFFLGHIGLLCAYLHSSNDNNVALVLAFYLLFYLRFLAKIPEIQKTWEKLGWVSVQNIKFSNPRKRTPKLETQKYNKNTPN